MTEQAYFGIVVILAFVGFLGTWRFRYKFPVLSSICPGKFLGVDLVDWALGYYTAVFFLYTFLTLIPSLANVQLVFWLLLITAGFSVFAVYFAFIQTVSRDMGASWSIAGAGLNLGITTVVYLSALTTDLPTFLLQVETSLVVGFGFAIAIGVGSAALTNILFFKFLNDLIISREEYEVLKVIAQVTAVALTLVILLGFALLQVKADGPMITYEVLVTVLALSVITALAEVCLNFWIGPAMVMLNFSNGHDNLPPDFSRIRRLAFALGAISIVSWFVMMVLVILRDININVELVISGYAVFVITAVIISQLIDRAYDLTNDQD